MLDDFNSLSFSKQTSVVFIKMHESFIPQKGTDLEENPSECKRKQELWTGDFEKPSPFPSENKKVFTLHEYRICQPDVKWTREFSQN